MAFAICDAVHGNIDAAAQMYGWVDQLARQLGAEAGDRVPFEKYAKAAESLLKPSSAARAIDSGAKQIERVDLLVQQIGATFGLNNPVLNETVAIVDARLNLNRMEMLVSQVAQSNSRFSGTTHACTTAARFLVIVSVL